MLAGDVPLMFLPVHVAMAQVKSGRLVVLAAAGERRSALAPDVPTLAELGYPERRGRPLVRHAGAGRNAARDHRPGPRRHGHGACPARGEIALAAQGMEVAPSSPEEMAALMRRDAARWAAVVKQAGIKAE